MKTILLDSNIYDRLEEDAEACRALSAQVSNGEVAVIATPKIVDELRNSPFDGIPTWFPVSVEPEAVTVLGHARLGMTRLSNGDVYRAHRGKSKKVPDAIIAHSANALADIAVSDDGRFRHRLRAISQQCRVMSFDKFREWLNLVDD